MSEIRTINRALISVSNKKGIVKFASSLAQQGIEILSTGGTAKLLQENGLKVTQVSDYTGFPEMMDGRIKTLHPKIHGALLGRRGIDDQTMEQHGINKIDLVVVNLYPFEQTISQENCSLEDAIENIDIGGPTMLRASAKNHRDVTVIVDPLDYDSVLAQLEKHQGTDYKLRSKLAWKTFAHTAKYDAAISNYLGLKLEENDSSVFPQSYSTQYHKLQTMRYGENPHQAAAFYKQANLEEASVATATQLQGKELSFNNVADTDAALECVKLFEQPACVIVKHANPCGVAVADDIHQAYQKAFKTDPTSAFGGIIAFNKELDPETAKSIIDNQFVEVIIAPKVSERAKIVLSDKKNIRLLECGNFSKAIQDWDYKKVTGGLLIQQRDLGKIEKEDLKVVSKLSPSEDQLRDLLFCWKVAKCVKSNAIVYAKNGQTIGVGAGQMSRVYSAKIAGIKASDEGLEVAGSVMASDAFFPFRDGIDAAAKAGISAIIQPGGSLRDQEIIDAANEHNIAMVFTGMRHFKH